VNVARERLKIFNLPHQVVLFFAFCQMSVVAQTVICTTEDGISFSTTTPDRYSLTAKQCVPASSPFISNDVTQDEPSLQNGGSLDVGEADYSDQMHLYDDDSDIISVPTIRWEIRSRRPVHKTTQINQMVFQTNKQLPFSDLMISVGQNYRIDPLFLHAIAKVESGNNLMAVSPVGARGLMQLMPNTARQYGKFSDISDLHDPVTNVSISAAHLKSLQSRFGNNLSLILAAYNAGEGAVAKYGNTVPPYRETQQYVVKVLKNYDKFRQNSK
jgi:Transglycosylase SLT domain